MEEALSRGGNRGSSIPNGVGGRGWRRLFPFCDANRREEKAKQGKGRNYDENSTVHYVKNWPGDEKISAGFLK